VDALVKNKPRGRPFPNGNAGRKPGSKNRSTLVAHALLRDEQDALVRKAIEIAKAGDGPMLKFLLGRLLPNERAVQMDLPVIGSASDAATALAKIADAVRQGEIVASEAAAFSSLVTNYARVLHITELEARVRQIEEHLQKREEVDVSKS
jgi:hypothetical protein